MSVVDMKVLTAHHALGINNLHFMPGIYGAFISVICSATYQVFGTYGANYSTFFRRGLDHPKWQLAGIGVAIGMGVVGGLLTALLTRLLCRRPENENLFTDAAMYHVPDDFQDLDDVPLRRPTPPRLSESQDISMREFKSFRGA